MSAEEGGGEWRRRGGKKETRTDDAEVLVEAVTDEDATEVDEHAKLLVRDLERDEGVSRVHRVEVASYEWRGQDGMRSGKGKRTHLECRRTR